MDGADRRTVELEVAATFEDPVEDRLSEVLVVEDTAPRVERLVGGEDHGPLAAVPVVDDVEEHVGRVGAVGEVADLVHDEQGGMRVRKECLGEAAAAAGSGEVVDQLGGGGEEGIE